MLIEKVKVHAISATIRIPHRALTLTQITVFLGVGPALQVPFSSVNVANASEIFADSKMMKNRSSNTRRIFAFGDRRPSGLPVYSSQVKYTMYGMATTSTTMAMMVEGFWSKKYFLER
jgi:hypothetical protein